MKSDKYHYQEAIHMADFIARTIQSELIDHWTHAGMPNESQELLVEAQSLLYKYYTALSNRQDEVE